MPSAMGSGEGSEFRSPISIATIGGLITSTMLTLVVVPVAVENGSVDYSYRAAFLPAGPYTVAFSCGDDDPAADDVLVFSAPQNATVQSNLIATVDFEPPPGS